MDWLTQVSCQTTSFWEFTQTRCSPNWVIPAVIVLVGVMILMMAYEVWKGRR